MNQCIGKYPDQRKSFYQPTMQIVGTVCFLVWMFALGCTSKHDTATAAHVKHEQEGGLATSSKGNSSENQFAKRLPTFEKIRPEDPIQKPALPTGQIRFSDQAKEYGIDFVYDNGSQGKSIMPETIGGGVGCFDYDRNGATDFCFVQGGPLSTDERAASDLPGLYANDGKGRFRNVGTLANLKQMGYGQGIAIGDIDDDGFEDVYLTTFGNNTFLRNMGDGTFKDQTVFAGLQGGRWSSSAAFADLNGDQLLDLYVATYVAYDLAKPRPCFNSKGESRMCGPKVFDSQPDYCFINQGDGRFIESSLALGLIGENGKGLGVAVADFNDDLLPDIYVANDETPNFLFVHQPNHIYQEQAMRLGCAVSYAGQPQASMGLAIGDYDRDQRLDIYATHFYEEYNTMYRNRGSSGFQDVTGTIGLREPTLLQLGFGTCMQDFDLNGKQELFVANGHVENSPSNPVFAMPAQLFTYQGPRWTEISDELGGYFAKKWVGRGVATHDFDRDGDLDLIIVHQNDPVSLLENQSARCEWLGLEFVGHASNRFGIGVRVDLTVNGEKFTQQLVGGSSYASSHEKYLVFGWQEGTSKDCELAVTWPSGRVQGMKVAPSRRLTIHEPPL